MLKSLIFFLTVLFLLFPSSAFGNLPEIARAVEPKMHTGAAEKALSFIEQRQVQADEFAIHVGVLLQQEVSPPAQEALANAAELFQGLASQSQRLKSEWNKSADADTYISLPPMGRSPYSLTLFNKIRTFQKDVEQRISHQARNIENISEQLATLNSNLETQLFDYSRLKRNETDMPFAFEKVAYIFSLQAKYSLLSLRLSKLKKHQDAVYALRREGAELIRRCLEHIKIAKEDLADRKEKMEQAVLEQDNLFKDVQKAMNALDTNLLRYEVQAEAIEKKLEAEKKNEDKKRVLAAELKRIASIQESIGLKRHGLEQKKLESKIKMLKATFLYYRIRHHAGQQEDEAGDSIRYWMEKQDYLVNISKALQEERLLFSQQKNLIQQKLLLTGDELYTAADHKLKDSLTALEQQMLKEQGLLDNAISTLLENQGKVNALIDEINWYLNVLQQEMPWYENLSIYFEKNLRKSWDNFLSVIYYPFFSFNQLEISIAAILKFISLLIIGLILMRVIRSKAAGLLEKRTRLANGSITSITTLGYYISVVLGFFIILSTMGVNLTQLTVVFGALGVGIGFGLQTIMNNFVSGIILLAERVIKTGDIVNLESGVTGEVKKVAIRSTVIRTVNGDDIIVPNSEFVSGRVNSWTYKDDWRRLTVPFGVSYRSDPDTIVRLAIEAAREVEITREDTDHQVTVFFEGYGESSLNFSIRVWCRVYQLRALSGLRSDYYFVLFRKLKEAGIEIPFPQRDLHLRSVSSQAAEALA